MAPLRGIGHEGVGQRLSQPFAQPSQGHLGIPTFEVCQQQAEQRIAAATEGLALGATTNMGRAGGI